MAAVFATLFQVLLLFLSFIMIVLILLQRGRGGGLAGAFGGMGGQSAFGTKAGDVFTRITVVVAVLWVLSAGLMGLTARASQNSKSKAYLNSSTEAAAASEIDQTGEIKSKSAAPGLPSGTHAGEVAAPAAGGAAGAAAPAATAAPAETKAPPEQPKAEKEPKSESAAPPAKEKP